MPGNHVTAFSGVGLALPNRQAGAQQNSYNYGQSRLHLTAEAEGACILP
jgi:hypothetical protein